MASGSVCIVDDDPDVLRSLAFEMSTQGYTVLPYASADALIDAEEVPDAGCLVVDHRLPRIDGLYLIEILRARGLTAPAILITTNPGLHLRTRCDSLGIPIVEKPLIEDDLSEQVRRALAR